MAKYDRHIRDFERAVFIYDEDVIDEICVGVYDQEYKASVGKFYIQWVEFRGTSPAPKLVAFDDGWFALNECQDLLGKMAKADNKSITPIKMCSILKSLGFKDNTPIQ